MEVDLPPEEESKIEEKLTLAKKLSDDGQKSEAVLVYNEILTNVKRMLGDLHPTTLRCKTDLSLVLHLQGKWDECLKLLREVKEVTETTLGPGHVKSLNTSVRLADALRCQKNYEEAEKIFFQVLERVLENQSSTSGPMDGDVELEIAKAKYGIHLIIKATMDQLKYDGVLDICTRLLQFEEKYRGPTNENAFELRKKIASLHFQKGKLLQATTMAYDILSDRLLVQSPMHPNVVEASEVYKHYFQALNYETSFPKPNEIDAEKEEFLKNRRKMLTFFGKIMKQKSRF